MKDHFYRDFELLFRGDRSEIKERLRVYLPFVRPLLDLYPDALALDVGCGRGEWLETLRDQGFKVLGVDLDEGMLEDCQALQLEVRHEDALSVLRSMNDESASLVSAFHLVEHIAFDDLRSLVEQAHRVLRPGGLLIMETPNPENLTMAASRFYLDPTHTRPIPPGLLSFVPRYYGFSKSIVFRLQESAALRQESSPALLDVLEGVSPDYAVIAQKSASEEVLDRFQSAFALDMGLTIETLTSRYDQSIREEMIVQREKIQSLESSLNSVLDSASWRLTSPLRWLGKGLRRLKQMFMR